MKIFYLYINNLRFKAHKFYKQSSYPPRLNFTLDIALRFKKLSTKAG